MARTLLWIVIAVVLVAGGYWMFKTGADPRSRDASGRCLLRARVFTDGEGTANPRRIVGMQNLDDADWVDVQVTVDGVFTTGPQANQPTGAYDQKLPTYDSGVAAHKVREIPLDDFRSAQGPRWIPMTMRVTRAKLSAHIAGEACTYETAVPQGK